MSEVAFTIPGRPKAWQRTVETAGKHGGRVRFNPQDMKQYQRMIAQIAGLAMRGKSKLSGAIRMQVLCVYAIPPSWPKAKREAALDGKVWKTTVPDLDNLEKMIADALNGVAYGDDAQIALKSGGKRYGSPERTDVRLSMMDVLDDHSSRGEFLEASAARGGQSLLALDPPQACNTQNGGRG